MSKQGSVYFLEDNKNKVIKIGFSTNVPRRIKQLMTGNGNLKLIYQIDNCDMAYEKVLHNYFKEYRINGEFYSNLEVLRWIKHDKLQRKVLKEEGLIQ